MSESVIFSCWGGGGRFEQNYTEKKLSWLNILEFLIPVHKANISIICSSELKDIQYVQPVPGFHPVRNELVCSLRVFRQW